METHPIVCVRVLMCLLCLAHFLGVPLDLSGMNLADHPEPEENYLSKLHGSSSY